MLGGLGWNYVRSRRGKPTISQHLRRHPIATATGLVAINAWLVPHLFKES